MNGTNLVCSRYVEAYDGCGCDNCGHSLGEHPWRPPEAWLEMETTIESARRTARIWRP